MHRNILQRLAVFTAIGGVVVLTNSILTAQSQVAQTQFTLPRGSVFEVIAQHSFVSPKYSWVLSRDGTFLEAKREALFRSRLIEPGSYSLNAEISNANGTQRIQNSVKIIVPQVDRNSIQQNTNTLVFTHPELDKKSRIISTNDPFVIQIESADTDITKFVLDIDSSIDSSGDGDPANNNDAAGTYFSSRATPLFVWITDPKPNHTLTLQATFTDGTTKPQTIRLVDRITAQQEDKIQRAIATINEADLQNGAYAFSANFVKEINYPALFEWNFGDGNQSLLDTPIHKYTRNGSFKVNLKVRNLKTGEVSDEVQKNVMVTTVPSAPATPNNPDTESKDENGNSLLGLLIKVAIIGGIAVLIGIFVVFLISKLRRGSSLQEKLEAAEQKIVGMDNEDGDTLPPMEVIEDAEVIEEKEKSSFAKATEDKKDANEIKEKKEIKETKPQPKSEPQPQPKPQTHPQPKPQTGPTPDWLQPKKDSRDSKDSKPEVDTQDVTPEQKPSNPKSKNPPSTPIPNTQPPTPQSSEENLPPWLQPTPAPVKEEKKITETDKDVDVNKGEEEKKETKEVSSFAKSTSPRLRGPGATEDKKEEKEPTRNAQRVTQNPSTPLRTGDQPQPKPTPDPQPTTPEHTPPPISKPEPQPQPKPQPKPQPEGPVPAWLQTNGKPQPNPEEPKKADDEPVAFLRAESIEEEQKKNGQDRTK
ncbi:MAG: hypothetical protein K9M03_03700 [Kiritimatiellales bacterium]|nr:hypothetical protein [Kiritimatiellales bacterium]